MKILSPSKLRKEAVQDIKNGERCIRKR